VGDGKRNAAPRADDALRATGPKFDAQIAIRAICDQINLW
jgi:hypothetical protein